MAPLLTFGTLGRIGFWMVLARNPNVEGSYNLIEDTFKKGATTCERLEKAWVGPSHST